MAFLGKMEKVEILTVLSKSFFFKYLLSQSSFCVIKVPSLSSHKVVIQPVNQHAD